MAVVELRGIVKRFGKVVAVDGVSLRIGDGEFYILLGPSGCGKTTTLRIIAGLEYPDEGSVIIDGVDVTNTEPKDRDVAMVFQNYALYPHMTVYDNIAFPLMIRRKKLGITREEVRKRVMEVAKLLRIEELLPRKPGQLSGGQKQRVALARALVRRPKVWLMDEPLSNLDALLRLAMRAELKRLQKELGITTVYVTHDQAEAMSMADRIAVMNRGKIMQEGPPMEIYLNPRHVFVASFIGAPPMNLVKCTVENTGGRVILRCPGIERSLNEDVEAEGEVILGFRPEFARIHKEPAPGRVEAKVYVVETLGSEAIVNLSIGEDTIVKVKTGIEQSLNIGEKVYLEIDWSKAVIFDSTTGNRLI